jgi:hypothetical protein
MYFLPCWMTGKPSGSAAHRSMVRMSRSTSLAKSGRSHMSAQRISPMDDIFFFTLRSDKLGTSNDIGTPFSQIVNYVNLQPKIFASLGEILLLAYGDKKQGAQNCAPYKFWQHFLDCSTHEIT